MIPLGDGKRKNFWLGGIGTYNWTLLFVSLLAEPVNQPKLQTKQLVDNIPNFQLFKPLLSSELAFILFCSKNL